MTPCFIAATLAGLLASGKPAKNARAYLFIGPSSRISPVVTELGERPNERPGPCKPQGSPTDFNQQIRETVGEIPLTAQAMTALRTGDASAGAAVSWNRKAGKGRADGFTSQIRGLPGIRRRNRSGNRRSVRHADEPRECLRLSSCCGPEQPLNRWPKGRLHASFRLGRAHRRDGQRAVVEGGASDARLRRLPPYSSAIASRPPRTAGCAVTMPVRR